MEKVYMNTIFMGQTPTVSVRQNPQLLLSVAMQQAFAVLQMPVLELEEWLKNEIEMNPVLEYVQEEEKASRSLSSEERELDFEKSRFEVLGSLDEGFESSLFGEEGSEESFIPYEMSLFEHLMLQAKLVLLPEELAIAEQIIGSLDERGFFCVGLPALFAQEQISLAGCVLEKIQKFDPPGIAAFNLQHSLLLQLGLKDKEHSLAYQIVLHHFNDLIHNRLSLLQKKLEVTVQEIERAIYKEIACLTLSPASRFNVEPAQPICADLLLTKEEESWQIEVNEEALPQFRINRIFLSTGQTTQETSFLRRQFAAAKWLERILDKRRKTLKEIAAFLVKRQEPFLSGKTRTPTPLTMQELADTLYLHHSTIVRAVAHKYVFCPQGMLPLRSFFSQAALACGDTEISSKQAQSLLQELISKEDQRTPLSDQALSRKMQRMGVPIARRTIAKYRRSLKISSSSARRRLSRKKAELSLAG